MDGCGSGARSDDRPSLLAAIGEPGDLQRLDRGELRALADEIRSFLVDTVCRTGGHLGPNLGVVELTLALHRVFRSPADTILWDTGHQAYVHKILTGRHDLFDRLRQPDGLSGYPSRAESEHDVIENSHASTALAWADGISKGHRLRGVTGRQVVAVIGDGALTGGMAWEALNNISAGDGQPVIIVLNDNGRSYAPTVGGLADHLAHLQSTPAQPRLAGWQRAVFGRPVPTGDRPAAQEPASDDIDARNLFECIGLRYLGPVDGHDVTAVETALRTARALRQSVVVHCVTKKGMGHPAAEQHEGDRMHVVRATRPAGTVPARPTWTSVFGREMVALGAERPDIVAMTAAMLEPVGLDAFATRFPSRVFDVGIAEQHAVTSAAGLATAGAHPVIALYATFLNRAFDQVLMDAALHRCGMTLVLDRAGMTGDDGPSHNGMWDLSLLRLVPGLRIAAPRDGTQLRTQLREAVAVEHAPTVLRFPKGDVPQDIVAVGRAGEVDILYRPSSGGGAPPDQPSVLLVSAGAMAATCLAVAERLGALGIPVTVVDPRWLCPVPSALIRLATRHSLVVTVEDNVRAGGFGCLLAQTLRDCSVYVPLQDFGIPHRFIEQGTRAQLLAEAGLSAPAISTGIVDLIDRLNSDPASGWQAVHGMELVS